MAPPPSNVRQRTHASVNGAAVREIAQGVSAALKDFQPNVEPPLRAYAFRGVVLVHTSGVFLAHLARANSEDNTSEPSINHMAGPTVLSERVLEEHDSPWARMAADSECVYTCRVDSVAQTQCVLDLDLQQAPQQLERRRKIALVAPLQNPLDQRHNHGLQGRVFEDLGRRLTRHRLLVWLCVCVWERVGGGMVGGSVGGKMRG